MKLFNISTLIFFIMFSFQSSVGNDNFLLLKNSGQRASADTMKSDEKTGYFKSYVYKTTNGEPQRIHIYFPKDRDSEKRLAPGLILFHGGGWSGGNPMQFRYVCQYFADRGIVAATASYYKHPKDSVKNLPKGESRKRICVEDAKSAVLWMKEYASELGIDPSRIITGGCSAGGHISVLATLNPDIGDPSVQTLTPDVSAYLLFSPAFWPAGRDEDPMVDVFAHLKPGMAPFIFFFGDEDGWRPWSLQLFKELRARDVPAEWWEAQDTGHNFWVKQPWLDFTIAAADRFLVSLGLLSSEGMPHPPVELYGPLPDELAGENRQSVK